ncbi:MAG: hypothetical protein WC767_03945 [Candidatus Paceibacterota bacterium]
MNHPIIKGPGAFDISASLFYSDGKRLSVYFVFRPKGFLDVCEVTAVVNAVERQGAAGGMWKITLYVFSAKNMSTSDRKFLDHGQVINVHYSTDTREGHLL